MVNHQDLTGPDLAELSKINKTVRFKPACVDPSPVLPKPGKQWFYGSTGPTLGQR